MNALTGIFRRAMFVMSIALFAFGLIFPWSPVAEAAIESCRTDPIVYLSDGTTITVTVDIGADVSAVKTVGYFIHTPHGIKMVRVEHTPLPGFTGKEQFAFNDDAQPGQFLTDTVVQTTYNKIPVTATTYLDQQVKAVTGVNAQHLKATLYR